MFQRPKKRLQAFEEVDVWYDNQVVGINTLAGKMKQISIEAMLSKEYTNHSIRATSITILDTKGFEARHIMSVSGHRQESNICSYASKTPVSMKFAMSKAIANTIDNNTGTEITTDSPKEPLRVINGNSSKPSQFNFSNCTVTIINH